MQKTPHGPQISSVFVALAALCWGITGGIAGLLIAKGWDPFVLSFCRGVIGLLFIACWRMLHPSGNNLANLQLWLWSVIAGIGVAGNFACYFFSIAKGSVAVGATLMYCAPVFVYLVSFGLKLEQPTPLKWAAIVVVIMGIVLLTGVYNVSASRVAPLAIGAGLLAGISYGLFIFAFKSAARFGSSQEVLLIAFAVLCILLAGTGNFQQTATLFTPADASCPRYSWRRCVIYFLYYWFKKCRTNGGFYCGNDRTRDSINAWRDNSESKPGCSASGWYCSDPGSRDHIRAVFKCTPLTFFFYFSLSCAGCNPTRILPTSVYQVD